jgi:flagellar basal body-associated protein FliL
MSENNWLESRKKKSRRTLLIVFLVVAASASFIFIRNNRELLFSKQERPSRVIVQPPPSKPAVANPPARPSGKAVIIEKNEPKASGGADSVTIPDFACRLRDGGALRVVLSLKLIFPSSALKREILLKREDLKVMVQKAIAEKSMNELNVDSLRGQAKRAMNKILEKAVISDVEFRNFSIEKVQRP